MTLVIPCTRSVVYVYSIPYILVYLYMLNQNTKIFYLLTSNKTLNEKMNYYIEPVEIKSYKFRQRRRKKILRNIIPKKTK